MKYLAHVHLPISILGQYMRETSQLPPVPTPQPPYLKNYKIPLWDLAFHAEGFAYWKHNATIK